MDVTIFEQDGVVYHAISHRSCIASSRATREAL